MERTGSISPTRNELGHRNRDRSHRSRPTVDLRSESALRWTAGVLSVLGLLIAGYLSLDGLLNSRSTCPVGGCERVLNSSYASVSLGGVEIGIHWFGVFGYLAILVTGLARGDRARLAAFGLSAFGFGMSLFLFGLQLVAIRAFCPFCLASGAVMTLLFVTSTVRILRFFGTDDEPGSRHWLWPLSDSRDKKRGEVS